MFTLYSIIHGAEFWLAVAIWSCGAIFGICVTMIGLWIGEKHDKHNAPNVGHTRQRMCRDVSGGNIFGGGVTDESTRDI